MPAEPPRALGKGLASLIPSGGLFERKEGRESPFREVPIDMIRPSATQPRRNFAQDLINELAQSILEKGILHPLLVRRVSDGYELISGERRLRAARQAGLERVPILIKDIAPKEQLELALVENLQRADLDPIEAARGYEELMRFGLTQEEVARRMGKDRSTVANSLRLLRLPERVQQALQSGEITMGHAKVLLSEPTPQQLLWLEQIMDGELSVRELEERLKVGLQERPQKQRKLRLEELAPAFLRLAEELRDYLGTQVKIQGGRKGRGKIVIEYYSEEQLNDVCQKLRLGG